MSDTSTDRHIPLTSLHNLRGLGGLPVDGGVFAPDQVYRSASLANLSADDIATLSDLGVATVYDLRTAEERSIEPDRTPPSATQVHLDVLADGKLSVTAAIGKIRTDPAAMNDMLGAGEMQKLMKESYRDFIRLLSATAAYREFFLGLSDTDRSGAALFHCTAGKDRTGWAAASLLMLLGAEEETIHADYLQTNTDLLPSFTPLLQNAAAKGVDPELLRDALGVQLGYLEAAHEQLESQYGTVERYFAEGLGLTSEAIDALRERFVA